MLTLSTLWLGQFLLSTLVCIHHLFDNIQDLTLRILLLMGRHTHPGPDGQTPTELSGLSNNEYTIWEMLASRYIHPESLQTFAVLSSTHRDILHKLAGTPSFWENLKATAVHHAVAKFDPISLLVMKELAEGPLIVSKDRVGIGESVDCVDKSPMWNCKGEPARDVENHVKRFLKLCYFPLYKVAACKSMLVMKNMREMGSEDDAARMESRVAWIIRKHCKKQLSIKGAYRLGADLHHLDARVPCGLSKACRKGYNKGTPKHPVLVLFKSESDAEFVFARRGIFRRNMKIQVEKCSMPWDMDARFTPGRREQL